MEYKPISKGLEHIGAPSRGIVLFASGKAAMWESNDGYAVMRWAESHTKPGNPYHDAALKQGGVLHVVVWVYALGDVTLELTSRDVGH